MKTIFCVFLHAVRSGGFDSWGACDSSARRLLPIVLCSNRSLTTCEWKKGSRKGPFRSGQVRAESIQRNDSTTFMRFLRRRLQAYEARTFEWTYTGNPLAA